MLTTAVDEIRRELSALSSRLEAVESRLAENGDVQVHSPELPPGLLDQVREITEEIFPGKCEFTSEFDPEHPDDRYLVVNVEAAGEMGEIVDRECVWDQRIRQLRPDLWDTVRLSVVPR